MKSSKVFRIGGLAIGGVLVAGMLGAGMDGTPVSWAKRVMLESLGAHTPVVQTASNEGQTEGGTLLHLVVRPAATGPSPEDIEAKKNLRQSGKQEGVGRPSTKEEMINHCMQQPRCRQKLQEVKKRKGRPPANPRPAAAGPSPEDIMQKKMGAPAMGNPQGPQSELVPLSGSSLLAWLNPFNPSVAEAAAFGGSVSPERSKGVLGSVYIATYGGWQYGNLPPYIGPSYPSYRINNPNTENYSYVLVRAVLPKDGNYLIEVRGTRGSTKMRHLNGGPIVENWPYTQIPCSICVYTDTKWYSAGYNYWYFWSVENNIRIYGATIESYP